MSKEFIVLTTKEKTPIIIGVSTIGKIEPEPSSDGNGSVITLNFSRGKDLWPQTEYVTASFDEIKAMIGL